MFHSLPSTTYRVLVVEDDSDTRENLCDILALDGYTVTGVSTAAQTLAHPDLDQFLAIVLDRRLPDDMADGLLPQLTTRAPETARIIVTGHADLEGSINALRHGASDYILKPIHPASLRASLQRVKELAEARQRAAQAERLAAVGQAVASVAHESRNALQRIQARVDLLKLSVEDDSDLLEDILGIDSANQSLCRMFEELRAFSGPLKLRCETCSIQEVIWKSWESVQPAAEQHNASLRFQGEDFACQLDPHRIEQVFRNLIENAMAACDTQPVISVATSRSTLHGLPALELTFRDNGPGFTEQQRSKAFEPFYTTKQEGTGLGLAISKRIVALHHGELEIDRRFSGGASFLITLPLATQSPIPACVEMPELETIHSV